MLAEEVEAGWRSSLVGSEVEKLSSVGYSFGLAFDPIGANVQLAFDLVIKPFSKRE